jgi:hypothetical protein
MRKTIIVILIGLLAALFLYKQCSVDPQNRNQLKRTTKICDGVFVETYNVFGQGALGTDLVADWLTDQKNFRIYIGTEDEGRSDGWWYQCFGDSVRVNHGQNKVESKMYNVSDLAKMNNFNHD